MKKSVCLSLVLLLVLSMAACGQSEKNPILGAWECPTEIQVFGELPEGVNQGQTIEAVYRFEFNEDGTGKWLFIANGKNPVSPHLDKAPVLKFTVEIQKIW